MSALHHVNVTQCEGSNETIASLNQQRGGYLRGFLAFITDSNREMTGNEDPCVV